MKAKKILSAFIAGVMMLSSMSFTAFADPAEPVANVLIDGKECTKTGDELEAAIADATESVVINDGEYLSGIDIGTTMPVTVNGGTFDGWAGICLTKDGSEITVNDGVFSSTLGIQMQGGTVTINGGKFTTSAIVWADGICRIKVTAGDLAAKQHLFMGDNGEITFEITGGQIEVPKDLTNTTINESSSITGGEIIADDTTVDDTLADYIPEELAPEKNTETGKTEIVKALIKNDTTGAEYDSLQTAIDEAVAGNVIKLMTNKKEIAGGKTINVAEDKDITIDLNGKKLTGSLLVHGKATVKNGTIENDAVLSGIESNGAAADLTVEDLTITTNRHALRIDGGKAHIISGTYTSEANGISAYTVNAGGEIATEVVIDGGTFNASPNADTHGPSIMLKNEGVTTVINGGTFNTGNSGGKRCLENYGTMTVNNGTFNGSFVANATTKVSNGKFKEWAATDDVYLADGKAVELNAEDYYEVVEAKAEIEGKRRYGSVASAIKAAEANDTVVAYGDINIDDNTEGLNNVGTLKATKESNITFDLDSVNFDGNVVAADSAKVEVFGGTYGGSFTEEGNGNIVLNAGSFKSEAVKDFVPVGSIIYKNGNVYSIELKTFEPTASANAYFDGWYTTANFEDGTKVEFNALTNNVIYYPKFSAVVYNITYDLNGGKVDNENPSSYTALDADIALNNPTKAGYEFAGWTGTGLSAASKNVTIAAGSTGNKNYTANWTAEEYTISYELNGGSFADTEPTKHIYGTATALVSPKKEGSIFAGWYTDAAFTNIVTSLAADAYTADIKLYANWVDADAERTMNMYINGVNANDATTNLTGVEVKAGDIVTVDVKIENLTVAHAIWSIAYETDKFELVSTLTGEGRDENGVISDSVDFQNGEGYAPGSVLRTYKFKAKTLDNIGEDGIRAAFTISNTSAGTTYEDLDGDHVEAKNNGTLNVLFPAEKRSVIIKVDDEKVTGDKLTIPYDGEPHNVTVVTDPISDVQVTIEKDGKALTADQLDLTESGVYVVKYEVPKGNGYGYEMGVFTLTIGEPEYKVEVNTGKYYRADYVAGKKLVLVYTNAKGAYFAYDGNQMLDVTSRGYKFNDVETYDYVYAYVADGASAVAGIEANDKHKSVKSVFGESNKPKSVVYDNNMNNDEIGVDIKDITSVFSTYNVGATFTDNKYMIQILKADTDGNKYVNGVDTNSVVNEAYIK